MSLSNRLLRASAIRIRSSWSRFSLADIGRSSLRSPPLSPASTLIGSNCFCSASFKSASKLTTGGGGLRCFCLIAVGGAFELPLFCVAPLAVPGGGNLPLLLLDLLGGQLPFLLATDTLCGGGRLAGVERRGCRVDEVCAGIVFLFSSSGVLNFSMSRL